MKNLLIAIGILLSLSSNAQIFEVTEEITIIDGDSTFYTPNDFDLNVTRVDSKFNGRGKARIILFDDHNHTKMILKCKVVESFYREGANEEQFSFLLEHDVVGRIDFDTDRVGNERKIHLNHNKETGEFEKLLVLNY